MSRFRMSRSVSPLVIIFAISLLLLNAGVAYAQNTTTTTLTVAVAGRGGATSSVLGQPVLLLADVTPTPVGSVSGTVVFSSGGTFIGVATVTYLTGYGVATFQISSLPLGSYTFEAQYSGDGNNTASTSPTSAPLTVGLRPTATAVSSVSPSSTIVVGQPATVAAGVTDAATTGPAGSAIGITNVTSGAAGAFVPVSAAFGLKTAREGHTATLLQDGTVLIAGGYNVNGVLGSAEIYFWMQNSGGYFTPSSYSLQTARQNHTATLLPNGTVVIIGGQSALSITSALASAEMYTPGSGFQTMTGVTLNTARTRHTATLLSDGNILVVGGLSSSVATLRDIELCNNGGCTDLGNMLGEARAYHTATWLGSKNGYDYILVTGGDSVNDGEVLAYALASQTVTSYAIAGLPTARLSHSAVMLPDGTVLIVGGTTGGTTVSSAELCQVPLDPTTMQGSNCVSTSSSMSTARALQTATLLTSALVMVTGGFNDTSGVLSSVEYYTPSFDPLGTIAAPTTGDPTDSTTGCTLSLSGSGATTCNALVTPTAVDSAVRGVNLVYSGDTNHTGSSSPAVPLTIQPATTTITPISSANQSVFGQSVTFNAVVSCHRPAQPRRPGSSGA